LVADLRVRGREATKELAENQLPVLRSQFSVESLTPGRATIYNVDGTQIQFMN
jgi:hypothetical protein